MDWEPIETAPKDGTPIILANFDAVCLLTGAPHVWTARWVSHTKNIEGDVREEEDPHFWECSYAAMNENGTPTHWVPLPNICRVDWDRSEDNSGGSQGFRALEEAEAFAEQQRTRGCTVTLRDFASCQR